MNKGIDCTLASRKTSSLVAGNKCYLRARSNEAVPLIADLLLVHEQNTLANLLGVKRVALSWQKHPIPVVRAALMLHLLTFSRGDTVTVFDILTNCRYAGKDRLRVSGKATGIPQEQPAETQVSHPKTPQAD